MQIWLFPMRKSQIVLSSDKYISTPKSLVLITRTLHSKVAGKV